MIWGRGVDGSRGGRSRISNVTFGGTPGGPLCLVKERSKGGT